MTNDIPNIIKAVMKDAALNRADKLNIKDKEIYQLYRVDDKGDPVPTGLPFVVVVSPEGLLTRLSPKEAFELLKEVDNG